MVPSPSWLRSLAPQANTEPLDPRARECWLPAATAEMPVRPGTRVGVMRSEVVPSPIWPRALRPQAKTRPSVVVTRLWANPPATAATGASPARRSGTGLGVDPHRADLTVGSPGPQCPSARHARCGRRLRDAGDPGEVGGSGLDRSGPIERGAVTELARAVVAPGPDGSVASERRWAAPAAMATTLVRSRPRRAGLRRQRLAVRPAGPRSWGPTPRRVRRAQRREW